MAVKVKIQVIDYHDTNEVRAEIVLSSFIVGGNVDGDVEWADVYHTIRQEWDEIYDDGTNY
jgi:cytoskeletal protein CcmA (bactofilin family)